MNGSKLTTLQKNRSDWERGQFRFQQMAYSLPPGTNPWKDTEQIMKKHLTDPLAHTYGMTKRERNEYIKQNNYLSKTKEFYTNNTGRAPPQYYGPCAKGY